MNRSFRFLSATIAATTLVACAAAVSPEPSGDTEDALEGEVGAIPLPLTGQFAARVDTSGSGCPSGSSNSDVSSDGLVFTTTFSQHEIYLDPGVTKVEKNCDLKITFNATTDVQYSVGDFSYSGYAALDEGVRARLVTSNKFASSSTRTKRFSEFVGEEDSSFVLQERIGLPRGQWTKCGKEETLQIKTKLTVTQPSGSEGVGYFNLSSVDGSFTVRSRACTP